MKLFECMFGGLKILRLMVLVLCVVLMNATNETKACVFPRLAAAVHKVTHPFETLRGQSGCDPVQPPVGQQPPTGQPTQPNPPGGFPVLPPTNPLPKPPETKKADTVAPAPKVVLPSSIVLPDGQVAVFREATGDYHVPLPSVNQPAQVLSQPGFAWRPGYIAQPLVQGTFQTFQNAGQTIRGCVNGVCPNIAR